MEISTLIIIIGILLQIVAIIFLAINSKKKNQEKIVTLTTNSPEELQEFIKTHNLPPEMINHLKNGETAFKSTKTVRTVKYVNGQIVSDEIKTTTNEIPTNNFCPNCGAKIENPNNSICPYCNTNFTITK